MPTRKPTGTPPGHPIPPPPRRALPPPPNAEAIASAAGPEAIAAYVTGQRAMQAALAGLVFVADPAILRNLAHSAMRLSAGLIMMADAADEGPRQVAAELLAQLHGGLPEPPDGPGSTMPLSAAA